MHLVVGLGNPGREYEKTRHNVGFEVIDELARAGSFGGFKTQANARVAKGTIGGNETLLVKPMTFMNLSGDAVGSLLRFYKLGPEALVVVHDELDFEPGVVRVKIGGGHGGHNGLKSIIAHVSRDFTRVRVGVGKPPSREVGADHVLSGFDKKERALVDEAVALAVKAVETILSEGIPAAMNEFNRREKPDELEKKVE
jgi:PTH1 family peptidyl-tRNA hydrolase